MAEKISFYNFEFFSYSFDSKKLVKSRQGQRNPIYGKVAKNFCAY